MKTLLLLIAAALVGACTSSRPAPVSERTPPSRQTASAPPVAVSKPVTPPLPAPSAPEAKPDFHTVKPGDTLYTIAAAHGLDYRELALWNGIDNPGALRIGQELRLTAPQTGAVAAPLNLPGGVQAKPLEGAAPPPRPAASAPAVAASPSPGAVVTEPKGIRLPYSEQALAQLSKGEGVAPQAETRSETKPAARADSNTDATRPPEVGEWMWPVKGKVLATFNGTTSKGIDIGGKRGQPVLASAAGRVLYTGTGVRGMGKFIVIKHTDELISVYGHNDVVLVKHGQNVSRGQKIAEMGSSDADQVKLHFQIRRNGQAVDPLKLLPDSPLS